MLKSDDISSYYGGIVIIIEKSFVFWFCRVIVLIKWNKKFLCLLKVLNEDFSCIFGFDILG